MSSGELMLPQDRASLYRSVAELHAANIDQGFLSSLGLGFLSLMYRAIDEVDESVLVVSKSDKQVIGFIAGATSMRPIYRRMLRYWPQLFWALLPSLSSPQRVRRIIEILRYSSDKGACSKVTLPTAELLSIAVSHEFRGQRHADDLYRELCEHFLQQKLPAFKIVVGSVLLPAHKFYQRMGAKPTADVEVHHGSASTVYVQWLPLKLPTSNGQSSFLGQVQLVSARRE